MNIIMTQTTNKQTNICDASWTSWRQEEENKAVHWTEGWMRATKDVVNDRRCIQDDYTRQTDRTGHWTLHTIYTFSYWLLAKLSTFYFDFKLCSFSSFITVVSAWWQGLPAGTLPSGTQHTSLSNYLAVLETLRKENCPSLEHLVSGTQKCEVFSYFREEV